MNNINKIVISASAILFIIAISYVLICQNIFQKVEQQTNKALNDYSMLPDNQKIVDKVVLGDRRKKLFWGLDYRVKNAVLELVCTNKDNILLIIKDDINNLTIIDGVYFSTSFRIENGVKKGEAKIRKMDMLDSDYLDTQIDTMVSNSLSKTETNSIIKALEERIFSRNIGIGFDNTSTAFIDLANISDVKELITKCTPSNSN